MNESHPILDSLGAAGFVVKRAVFGREEIERLREEAARVAEEAGSACARNIRSKSRVFSDLPLQAPLRNLLPPGVKPVRSILFDKTPKENWPVAWHQDLTITVRTQVDVEGYGPWTFKDGAVHGLAPQWVLENMVTARIHLDDTPADNGALRVVPGSHLRGRIPADELPGAGDGEMVCECAAGDVLFMSPLVLHASRRSLKPGRRRILHFEYALQGALDERLRWHEEAEALT